MRLSRGSTKEQIGSFQEINLERIIELETDMVFQYGPGDENVNESLKKQDKSYIL